MYDFQFNAITTFETGQGYYRSEYFVLKVGLVFH